MSAEEVEDEYFTASRASQADNADAIVDNFIEGTFKIDWTSDKTNKAYVLRGSVEDGVDHDDRAGWPFSFHREEWVVIAVMIDVSCSAPRLVGLWGFSVCGDETNQFYLDSDKEDVWQFMSSHEDEIDGKWNNAFSVSQGDDAVDDDDFQCPVLSQSALGKLVGGALKPSLKRKTGGDEDGDGDSGGGGGEGGGGEGGEGGGGRCVELPGPGTIAELAAGAGVTSGKHFYKVVKTENVSRDKHVVVFKDGRYVSDNDEARLLAGLPKAGSGKADAKPVAGLSVFVQSTSGTRKIPATGAALILR